MSVPAIAQPVPSGTAPTSATRGAASHPEPAPEPAPPSAAVPIAAGLVAAAALLGFYLGVITVAQGWGHAAEQLEADRWFVGALVTGFGAQVGLFTYLRALHVRLHRHGAASGLAVSSGTSTAAMLACCAHHLADVLAVLGIAGAAAFLNEYKVPLLWVGIGMNAAGVAYLLRLIARARRQGAACH
jgi:hypothetical protein